MSIYLRKTRMIDVVVRSTKYCSTYGANKNPNREWTVSISVPAITKYTFLCHRITCRAWITWWRCLWIRPCSLFYISSHYRVKVVFRLKNNRLCWRMKPLKQMKCESNWQRNVKAFVYILPGRICTFQL